MSHYECKVCLNRYDMCTCSDSVEPVGLKESLSKEATERSIPTPDEVQEPIGTRKTVAPHTFAAPYGQDDTDGSEQVGGDHYGTGTDVYAFSLEREHDCLQHSAIKYIDRHKLKNGRQDIEKAISVLHRILKEQYND